MAKQKFVKGILQKKTINSNGEVTSRTPFLLKTLAQLVITKSGKNVDEALEEESHRAACKEYATLAAYQADLNAGKVKSDEIVYIRDPD